MPNIHSNTIVQGQNFSIMFLITNILLGRGLYPTPTAIATGAIVGVSSGVAHQLSIVLHLATKTNSVMES